MSRIGVFLCECGSAAAPVHVAESLREAIAGYSGVVHVEVCPDLCLDLGLELVKNAVPERALDAVVIASCAPSLHAKSAGQVMSDVGLGPSRVRLVDIGPSPVWLPDNRSQIDADVLAGRFRSAVDSLRERPAGEPSAPIEKRALVIGGGVAGIQAALDIADGGHQVLLVEKLPSIGGHMIQYAEVFPTLDCPQCVLTPKMVEVGQHPNIRLLTSAEVRGVSGPPGAFEVEIVRKTTKVDHALCTGCGACWENCPERVPSEFQAGLGERTAIYMPFPQAVPARPVIDAVNCRHMRYQRFVEGETPGKRPPQCRICERVCPVDAIDWEQGEQVLRERVGAIVVATGFELMPPSRIPEYADDPDVIDGIQFERMLSPGGPTGGEVRRPSDGTAPRSVAFISCAGSRDPEHGVAYCSRVCCMYLAKQALLYLDDVPQGQATVFYIDTRCTGKGYEEFLQRVQSGGVLYLRGKASRIYRDGDRLVVLGADTLSGQQVEAVCDLVVLGMAMLPGAGSAETAAMLGIGADSDGFLTTRHPKLKPQETTRGAVFVAGAIQGPKDIPDSVAQGSAAAGKVLALFARGEVPSEELVVT